MSRYTNLLVCELERRLKHFTDRAITHLPLIQNECTLAGQSAVSETIASARVQRGPSLGAKNWPRRGCYFFHPSRGRRKTFFPATSF
jgi:hypothetical protein